MQKYLALRWTPTTHPRNAPPTTYYANAKRSQYQQHDAHHTFAQYKATGNNNKPNIARLALRGDSDVVNVLNDASNKTCEREGRCVEKSDSKWIRPTLLETHGAVSRD